MMRAPKLTRRLALETRLRAPDGAGGYLEFWSDAGTLWAEITAGSGGDRLGEEAPLARARLRIIVRAAPHGAPSRPRPEDRFREGNRIYRIATVQEADPGMKYLICQAEEEVAT